MRRDFLVPVVLSVGLLFWFGCSKESDTIVLKLAHGLDQSHPVHKAMEFLRDRVWENSEGALKIEIYSNGQLGSERETIEQVQFGSIAMTKASTANLESFVPVMGVFSFPFIFRDSEHFWEVLLGPIGQRLLQSGEGVGLKGLCFYDAGARSFYLRDKKIESPSDLSGMKIRVMQSKTSIDMIKALGANPTPIPWGELYTSLQQGVVDGAENNPPSFLTSRHFEVCRYYSLVEHTRIPDILLIGKRNWDALPSEFQRVLQEAADQSMEYERILWREETENALDQIERSGIEVIRPDKALFEEKMREMHSNCNDPEIASLIDSIRNDH